MAKVINDEFDKKYPDPRDRNPSAHVEFITRGKATNRNDNLREVKEDESLTDEQFEKKHGEDLARSSGRDSHRRQR